MKLRAVPLVLAAALLAAGTAPAPAQFFSFGRNKIHYSEFDWHVLRTAHFDIYYYPEMRALAERGAFFAEEAYEHLRQKFNHALTARVPLIFYSSHLHFQQTNTIGGFIPEGVGGFFEFLKGRVVIPSDGSTWQFRHVIRHELVHVFMHSKIGRVLSDRRRAQDSFPPLWFVEGLAEYWSTTWDTQAEMVLRDAVLSGVAAGLGDMDRIYGSFLMYKQGQHALATIARTYGEEKILLLMENFWKASSFSEVLRLTIGRDYEEFDREWLYALKKEYYPLLARTDLPSLVTVNVTKEGFNAKPVVVTRDSITEVYFLGNRTGYTSVYRKSLSPADPDAPAETVVQGEKSATFEAFHPFRTRMAVSRDGTLAFVTKSGDRDVLHLYDLAAGRIRATFRFPGLVSLGSTTWSPSGDAVAFSAIDPAGASDLYVFTPGDRSLRRLTDDVYDDRDPAWSPDGGTIAFSSDRTPFGVEGTHNLFALDLAGGGIRHLTYGPENTLAPAWSPDGSYLAFTGDHEGVPNIWMMDMRTSPVDGLRGMRRITHLTTAAFDPAWTPSGGIVFAAFENFSFQLRLLDSAAAVFDTAAEVRSDLAGRGAPWSPQTLTGPSETRTLRYAGEYSLDIAQSALSTDPVFGTTAGAFAALSDILGNDQYYLLLTNTAETQSEILSSFNLALSRVSLGQRAATSYGIYRFSGRRYDLTDPALYYTERSFGGYLAVSYPLSRFDRIETSVSVTNSTKDVDVLIAERKALLLSNSVAYVHDNSLWGPSGPLDGWRFRLTLAFTTDIQYSNVNYASVILDYRRYLRLGERTAFASRAWLFHNTGKESRRFVLGGSWDLRGWPRWSLRGEKLWLTSHELRFPLLDEVALRFPVVGLTFRSIRGALFFDAGSAWDDAYRETYGCLGGGLRLNLFGILVLRYDLGKRIERNFTALQRGLFHQFFFGWDF